MAGPAFRSILVPVDGSAASDCALRLALRLVARDGEIVVAHVIDRAAIIAQCVTPYGGDPIPAIEVQEAEERAMFARASDRAGQAGVPLSTASLDGSAVSSITLLATNRHVGAIAMGTHGRSGAYLLAGKDDDITPWEQVFNAEEYLGTPKDQIVKTLAPGGHIGLFMGHQALADDWPKIGAWIAAKS
jgi:nucleotide-binding universal stress UspA family protein